MHELGHFIMNIPSTDKSYEDLADYFASNILVPRATIWHLHSESVRAICRTYGVSCMAANRIYEDYRLSHLSENKEINDKIHNWFFPAIIPETTARKPTHTKEQEEFEEDCPMWAEYHEMLEKFFPERLHNYVLR